MRALALLACVIGVGLIAFAVKRRVSWGHLVEPTMAEQRRAALSGQAKRYRITQPGAPRRQWRAVQRQKKPSARIALVK